MQSIQTCRKKRSAMAPRDAPGPNSPVVPRNGGDSANARTGKALTRRRSLGRFQCGARPPSRRTDTVFAPLSARPTETSNHTRAPALACLAHSPYPGQMRHAAYRASRERTCACGTEI